MTPNYKKNNILVVDDEETAVNRMSSYLQRKGFCVQAANNGCEALEAVRRVSPDLIICDVLMPRMDGFAFLKYLKSDDAYSRIPVIMLTIKNEPRDLDKGISLKADFYLPKPFALSHLLRFINLILK